VKGRIGNPWPSLAPVATPKKGEGKNTAFTEEEKFSKKDRTDSIEKKATGEEKGKGLRASDR